MSENEGDWWAPLANWRYGVGPTQKYALAVGGAIPGAQPVRSEEDMAREERRAAAFLFTLQHPTLADFAVEGANALRFWEPSAIHDAARAGLRSARTSGLSLGDIIGGRRR